MPNSEDTFEATHHEQWNALLRAPITGTECAFVDDPETEKEQIVVIYNARDVPPIVTVDVNSDQSLVTVKADGAPVAVMSCQSSTVPDAADVMLVARHAPYSG